MTLQELLKDYIPSPANNPGWPEELWENVIGKLQLGKKFREDLDKPDTQFLNGIFKAYKLNYTVSDAIEVLNRIGISESNALISWIGKMNTALEGIDINAFNDILTDTVHFDISLSQITMQDLRFILKKQFPDLTDFGFTDNFYQITDLAGLQELISYDPAPQYKWIKESSDCEDHARILRGWLSKINLGNITIAYCEVNVYLGDILKYVHAINLAVIKENGEYQFKFIEPQNNTVSYLDFDPPGLMVDNYKVRKLIF